MCIYVPLCTMTHSLCIFCRYNGYNGGWPSARLFGWSVADWSQPATPLRKKKKKSIVLLRKDTLVSQTYQLTQLMGFNIWQICAGCRWRRPRETSAFSEQYQCAAHSQVARTTTKHPHKGTSTRIHLTHVCYNCMSLVLQTLAYSPCLFLIASESTCMCRTALKVTQIFSFCCDTGGSCWDSTGAAVLFGGAPAWQ